MGGRGRSSGKGYRQMNIDELTERNNINVIIKKSEVVRNRMSDGGIGRVSSILFKKCACCGEYSIPTQEQNFVCPICDWIDDSYQNSHPNSSRGRNNICLSEAKIKCLKTDELNF